jgi:hypothetical protein
MEKSASIKEIGKALGIFHTKVSKIPKTDKNPFFKSTYAALPSILEAIADPLTESGLVFSQFPDGDDLTSILIHPESGEYLQASYSMHPQPEYSTGKDKSGEIVWRAPQPHTTPQSVGSAITYARRYALGAILGLNIDKDDDGNAASLPNTQPEPLPLLNEKQFASLKERVDAGEVGVIEKAKERFTIPASTIDRLLIKSTPEKPKAATGGKLAPTAAQFTALKKEVEGLSIADATPSLDKWALTEAQMEEIKTITTPF